MDRDFFLNAGIQPMPTWQNIPEVSPETLPENFFVKPTWESPLNPNSANDGFAIRELIGKLGTICNSDEIKISPEFLNSPPELQIPAMENLPILHNSVPISPNFPGISADPGFVERAAKFSCYGSRSFNGRTTQFGGRNAEFKPVCNNPLPRNSSSPVMNLAGPSSLGFLEIKNSFQELNTEKKTSAANSNDDSSVSEQNPCHKTVKTPPEINSRKRKAISKGKQKEIPTKEDEGDSKKAKQVEKKEEAKAKEPFKDYIHVRARRGQATDSHSLAERVRREKISERMKLLQDLVPGCNKVTGKALMLDEIINYVQSLQRQVEFLSMKLATVNPRMDYNMETHAPKDVFQQNGNLHHPNFEIDSSNMYGHHTSISSGLMGPLDTTICHTNGFVEAHPQFPTFFEEDLHSLVQMGFADNVNYSDPNQKSQMKLEL